MPTSVKKLSVTKLITENERPFGVLVARVLRFKPITTAYGTSLQLKGNFRLVLPKNPGEKGENLEFDSNVCYVPSAVETAIEVALMDTDPANFKGAELAVKIFKKENKKVATGYEWAFEKLIEPSSQVDPLAHLLDKVSKINLALPAPTEAKKK